MAVQDPIPAARSISIERKTISVVAMTVLTIGVWIVRLVYFRDLTGYESYTYVALCWIATASTLLLALEWVWSKHRADTLAKPAIPKHRWLNRRRFFRIDYRAQDEWPVVVVQFADNLPRHQLIYRIYDLSEEGICFKDDNSLGRATIISGFVRWSNGEKDLFQGTIVRRREAQICIQLDRKLNERSVYADQRRLIRLSRKSSGS